MFCGYWLVTNDSHFVKMTSAGPALFGAILFGMAPSSHQKKQTEERLQTPPCRLLA